MTSGCVGVSWCEGLCSTSFLKEIQSDIDDAIAKYNEALRQQSKSVSSGRDVDSDVGRRPENQEAGVCVANPSKLFGHPLGPSCDVVSSLQIFQTGLDPPGRGQEGKGAGKRSGEVMRNVHALCRWFVPVFGVGLRV